MAQRWKTASIKLVEENYTTKGAKWCSEEISRRGYTPRTPNAVQMFAETRGIPCSVERYTTSEHIDACIRRSYQRNGPSMKECAIACQRPQSWIVRRARALGLRPLRNPRYRVMTDSESEIILANRHMPVPFIWQALKDRGYNRPPSTIRDHLARNKAVETRDRPLRAHEAAELMGVHSSQISRWIKKRILRARRAGDLDQSTGSPYLIEMKDLARFCVQYPTVWDIRKVDQVWFVDCIVNNASYALKDDGLMVRVMGALEANPKLDGHAIAERFGTSEANVTKARRLLSEEQKDAA